MLGFSGATSPFLSALPSEGGGNRTLCPRLDPVSRRSRSIIWMSHSSKLTRGGFQSLSHLYHQRPEEGQGGV